MIFEIDSEVGLLMLGILVGNSDRMGFSAGSRLALVECVGVIILAFGLAIMEGFLMVAIWLAMFGIVS